jgi:hypothetical protein
MTMPYPMPHRCPVCGHGLTVVEVHCKSCRTTLNGDFAPCEFCSLSVEKRALLKSFVAVGGSIKALEKVLGVSYPTVKKRLGELARELGVADRMPAYDPRKLAEERGDILDQLAAGEIDADEAAAKLAEL